MKVAIMTDTNSGISAAEGQSMGIYVIPMPVLIDGEVYYEGVNLTREQFYGVMLEGKDVSTTQPSPGDVMALWDRALENHDAVVYIPMSSGLSTSCQTALALARDYGGKVQVADNHSISVPQRYAVLDALEMARAGWEAEQIKAALERAAGDTIIYIGVDTLEYLKRGGRITPAAAKMGGILQIKPLLQIRGERLDAFARVRGTMNCKKRLIEEMQVWVEAYRHSGDPFAVAAAGTFLSKAEEREWVCMAQEVFPGRTIRYDPLAFSIGCHVGPGAFGMAVSKRLPAAPDTGPLTGRSAPAESQARSG